ncbi:TapB family protein [Runella limosa]|uniref:TapB family protein n=1 Tax=Runella limosa TaxID=370978 RepID=UPI0003FF0E0F|nr:hypothetical protein [Runella limosa]
MKRFLIICFTLVGLVVQLRAQSCLGVTMKAGAGFEVLSYNAKDKLTGRLLYTVKDVANDNGTMIMKMEVQSFDAKDKPQMTNSYQCRCKGNEFMVDMTSMMASQENPMMKDAKMTFTSNDLTYSDTYTVGSTLKDASLTGDGTMGGSMNVTYNLTLKNRKVASQESITVPAGTYNAYKVTADMSVATKTIVNLSFDFQAVSYRAPGVLWDIKTETYRKDKLMAYSVLSKVF